MALESAITSSVSRKNHLIGTSFLYGMIFAALATASWALGGPMPTPAVLATIGLGALLVYGAVIDSHWLYIPDRVSIGLFPLGLLATWLLDPQALIAHTVAGLVAGTFVWAVDRLYRTLRGRSGIGMGDAKLFASAGAWLGPEALPSVLLIGSLCAIAVIFFKHFKDGGTAASRRLAFGPHLSLGFWIVWLFGPLSLAV